MKKRKPNVKNRNPKQGQQGAQYTGHDLTEVSLRIARSLEPTYQPKGYRLP